MKDYKEVASDVFRRRDAHEAKVRHREKVFRRVTATLSTIAIIICCVMTIGVGYVFAAGLGIIDDFLGFFENRSGTQLSDNQQQYIEESYAEIGESVTRNGVTVTINGAITDGTMAYILVDIVAPTGQNIEDLPLGFDIEFEKLKLEGQEDDHISSVSTGCIILSDNDGQENTAAMLIQYNVYQFLGSNFSLADGKERTLQLQNLFYHEKEYPYSLCTVAEGKWEYKFAFTAVENKEVELLTAPISGSYSQISGKQVDATITSILMKGLSASVYYTLAPDEVQEAGDFGVLRFEMKDGTEICAYPAKAGQIAQIEDGDLVPNTSSHYCTYVFDAPINYENVETLHIGEIEIDIGA